MSMEMTDKAPLQQHRVERKHHKKTRKRKNLWAVTLALGLILVILGSVLVSRLLTDRKIGREEVIHKTVTYSGFHREVKHGGNYFPRDIELYFAEEAGFLLIDGSCTSWGIEDKLWALQEGETVQLLLHPDGLHVMQMEVQGQVLLEFDYAQKRMRQDTLFRAGMGLLCYGVAALLVLQVQKSEKKKCV